MRKIWHRSALPGAGIVVVFAGLLALTVSLRPAFAAPGDLDPTFGSGGLAEAAVTSYSLGQAVALQPDGKIVVAGSTIDGIAVARFEADGALDTSFGASGHAPSVQGAAHAVAVQPDGKIVAAGSTSDGAVEVVRYNADGTLDTSFGVGGFEQGPLGEAQGIAIQPDGRIVLAGSSPDPDEQFRDNVLILRFDASGTPDATFGLGGVVHTSVGQWSDAWDLALQPDGKIVVSGRGGEFANTMALLRYLPDGELDPGFGSAGIVTAPLDWAAAVAIQPDGRIVTAGNLDTELGVARFLPDGSIDPSFGSGGLSKVGTGGLRFASDVVLQPNGAIVVSESALQVFAVVRFAPTGALDSTFGHNGIARSAFGFWSGARAVAIEADGRIVAAGFVSRESETHLAVVRYRVTSPTTIFATPLLVPYGRRITLSGTASIQQPGVAVRITRGSCFDLSTKRVAQTEEGASGEWTSAVAPGTRAEYRAEIAGERSVAVDVQVRPRLTVRRLTRSRVEARALYGHSLEGETITLQRLRRGAGWRDIGHGTLRRIGRAGGGVLSAATIKTGQRPGRIRAFLEQPNPYACFAEAVSRSIPR